MTLFYKSYRLWQHWEHPYYVFKMGLVTWRSCEQHCLVRRCMRLFLQKVLSVLAERPLIIQDTGSWTFGGWPLQAESDQMQKMLAEALDHAGIDAKLSNEMSNRLYHKLLINAVINPLTAIYGVTNGDLPQDPMRKKLMAALHAESEAILKAVGWRHDEDSWERLLTICKQTASNESSMLRDVKAGRMTEVDWINGGIAELAKRFNMQSPLNDAMTAIIKSLTI